MSEETTPTNLEINKRLSERVEMTLQGKIILDGLELLGGVKNLSQHGLYFHLKTENANQIKPSHLHAKVEIFIGSKLEKFVKPEGTIIRITENPEGKFLGIEFN